MITLILLQLTKKLNTQSFKLRWVKTWNSTNWPNTLNKRTQTVNMYQQQNQFFLVTQITGTAVKQGLQQIWLILSITFYTKCQQIMQKMFHFQQILSFYFNSLFLFLIFFIIHLMPSITKNVFVEIMELFSDQSKSKRLYKKAQSLYLMKSYKITNVSAEQSIQSYDRLQAKYTSGQLQVDENDWHKNQRKLFIWFLICYCQQRKKTIQELEDKEWDQMSEIFFGKNQLFLKFQGLSILKNTKRHNWIIEDDQLLQKFVQSINSKQWNSISKAIFFESQKGRFISAKQCRERWFNHICKQINKDGWTQEEDIKILKMTLQIGKKWSRIARQLETHRTEHMVKNRFNSIINKIRRKKLQNELSLTRKALSLLEQECKEQKQEELNNQQELDQQSQNKEQEEMQQQGGENKQEQKQRLSIPIIPKVEQREQTSIRSDAGKKSSKQTEDMQQYNLSELPQGEIKGLQNLINKKQKGCFSFNPDESQAIENLQPLILSMTPSSVKGLSPGFSNSFLASIGDFIRKQDGSGFISPAPQCFSPGPGGFFQSFSPGFQNFFSALDREKNGLSSSRECISFTPIPMQLSSELKLSGHLAKKQGKQGNQ